MSSHCARDGGAFLNRRLRPLTTILAEVETFKPSSPSPGAVRAINSTIKAPLKKDFPPQYGKAQNPLGVCWPSGVSEVGEWLLDCLKRLAIQAHTSAEGFN